MRYIKTACFFPVWIDVQKVLEISVHKRIPRLFVDCEQAFKFHLATLCLHVKKKKKYSPPDKIPKNNHQQSNNEQHNTNGFLAFDHGDRFGYDEYSCQINPTKSKPQQYVCINRDNAIAIQNKRNKNTKGKNPI
jgi:hypothetical protein